MKTYMLQVKHRLEIGNLMWSMKTQGEMEYLWAETDDLAGNLIQVKLIQLKLVTVIVEESHVIGIDREMKWAERLTIVKEVHCACDWLLACGGMCEYP